MSTPLWQPRARVPRLAEAAVERARLTVVPGRRTRAPRLPFVSLVSLLLVTGVVGLLLFNTNMQQLSFVASSMEEQASVLAAEEESLRMQLHRLRDPQHLAARARRLGMVPAGSPAFVRLTDGKVLGRPGSAEPADAMRIAPPPPVKPLSLQPQLVVLDRVEARTARGAGSGRDTTGPREGTSTDRATTSRRKNVHRSEDAKPPRRRTP